MAPGRVPGATSRRAAWGLALALVALHAIWASSGLFEHHIGHPDAFKTAGRTRAIVETGDWWTIHWNAEPSFAKPPLQYWLGAALLRAGWPLERATRVGSFVFATGLLLVAAWLARELAPAQPWAVPAAVAATASVGMLTRLGRSALLDAGQAFFVALALASVLAAVRRPRAWLLVGLAVGLGALQKTPAALAAATVLVAVLGARGEPSVGAGLTRSPCFRAGAVLALGLLALWPLIQTLQHGSAFYSEFFGGQIFARLRPDAGPGTTSVTRWLGSVHEDAPVTWALLLAACALVPLVGRLRRDGPLLGVALVCIASAALLSLARGPTYPRYALALLAPLAAVAVAAAARLPLPGVWLPLAGLLLVGANADGLARARRPGRDASLERALAERVRATLAPDEAVVIAASGLRASAFVFYANLDRPVVTLAEWRGSSRPPGPTRGVARKTDVARLRASLGRVSVAAEQGDYAVWSYRPDAPPR